tara:strand:+ start:266 stop:517 length:252 start_codon:yes stop_codon:yes gene_type:complete
MTKRGTIAIMQKMEAQSWVAQSEWKQLYGEDSQHFRHLETRWKTLYMILKACGYDHDTELRKAIFGMDIKGRGVADIGSYIVA